MLTISDDASIPIKTIREFQNIRSINYLLADKGIAGIEFAQKLGIYFPEANFLCYPSVYIVDENNKITYVKYSDSLLGSLNLAIIYNRLLWEYAPPHSTTNALVSYRR
ncbi:Thioredoxin-like family protein [[Mycoplasma] cavipharyngis]